MSDFLIQVGDLADSRRIAQAFQDRPGMKDRIPQICKFRWGSIVVQPPPGRGYRPYEESDVLYACIGRGRVIGYEHESAGESGFSQRMAQAWSSGAFANDFLQSLTGMFALAIADENGFAIVTDLLGAQPVYQAVQRSGPGFCVGTSADLVAEVAGRTTEFDLASIGEFVVHDQITFPHTTYGGVSELGPAAVHAWRQGVDGAMQSASATYWNPAEPGSWPGREEISGDLETAIRSAALELSRGANRIAVTLSGGRDSRTVLAALRPYGVAAALTYCTRENRETETAARVAQAAGISHSLVHRNPHFYGTLLERAMSGIGSEVRAEAHGFAILDAGLATKYDVVVGGYLSDTLLKDHFMPQTQRERFRRKSIRERFRELFVRRSRQDRSGGRWSASERLLSPPIREQVTQRRQRRLRDIASLRPETAEEWQGFWPISRQHDVGSAWGNSRLFCADELFYFRKIIEVAARLSPRDRYEGTASRIAFDRICGDLNTIINANTGVAVSAGVDEEGRYYNRLRKTGQLAEFRSLSRSDTPWNDVQHSWADQKLLLLHSPDWSRYRDEVLRSRATEVLDSILAAEYRGLIRRFTPEDDPRVNMALVQMGLHIAGQLS